MAHSGEAVNLREDTTPGAWRRYVERLQETPPRERLARAFDLSAQVRALTMAGVRRDLPSASAREQAHEFLRRVYGGALASKVIPHLP